MAAKIPPILAS